MAIIPQITFFRWEDDIEILGDLERLKLLFENLPDDQLIKALEEERGKGRDKYPVRAMWNAFLALFVLQHLTMASLIRELNRNVQLRYLCGFEHLSKVPKAHNFSRFIGKLMKRQKELDKIFAALVKGLMEVLPEYGKRLAMDSKFIDSHANRQSKRENPDRRSETDADVGVKKYLGVHEDGTPWEKKIRCFGFKLHLVTDATYDLPVSYAVSKASESDVVWGHTMVDEMLLDRKEIIARCEYLTADKGYDDGKLIRKLLGEEVGIRPVIDKRALWKDEKERELPGYGNIYYNEDGEVICYDLKGGKRRTMCCDGYESGRGCLRKKCPAKAYGFKCASADICPARGVIRIPLGTDWRIFNAVDRSSLKWKREYAHRSSVERVYSRMDVSLGFELHSLRGQRRVRLQCSMGLITMLGMALGRIRQNKPELMRSLVRSA